MGNGFPVPCSIICLELLHCLRETRKFKEEISSVEMLKYMVDTPYKVSSDNDNCQTKGGFCIGSDDVKK